MTDYRRLAIFWRDLSAANAAAGEEREAQACAMVARLYEARAKASWPGAIELLDRIIGGEGAREEGEASPHRKEATSETASQRLPVQNVQPDSAPVAPPSSALPAPSDCDATLPDGTEAPWHCVLPGGHSGDHIANTGPGTPELARWPNVASPARDEAALKEYDEARKYISVGMIANRIDEGEAADLAEFVRAADALRQKEK